MFRGLRGEFTNIPHTTLSYDYNMTLSILRYEQQYSFRLLQSGDMLLATYIVISHGVP